MKAILLAAGMGTRLRPLTLNTPKSLIEVNDKPLLERQIEFLKEKGINDIIVVTGYLNEKFEYLVNKYNVRLVFNEKFDIYNNIYTMYLVRNYLEDSYVIDADVYINNNFLLENPETSMYFSAYKENIKNEWQIIYDNAARVKDIIVAQEDVKGFILSGVSFWKKEDAKKIVSKLEYIVENEDFKTLYWDDVVKDNLDMLDIYIKKIESNDIFEIDSIEDLKKVKFLLNLN